MLQISIWSSMRPSGDHHSPPPLPAPPDDDDIWAVALEMGWPSSSPPGGASFHRSCIVVRASRSTSTLDPTQEVSTAAIISMRSSPAGRSPPLLPHSMLRTMDSGMTAISASTSRRRTAFCRSSSVAQTTLMDLLRGSLIMSATVVPSFEGSSDVL
eukprot:6178775-Pleurochrysis_carterae.AAC.5